MAESRLPGRARVTKVIRDGTSVYTEGTIHDRVVKLVEETGKLYGFDVYDYVDEIIYHSSQVRRGGRVRGGSYFTVRADGTRVLAIGSRTLAKTRAGQIKTAMHELIHAQEWTNFIKNFTGSRTEGRRLFFQPFGSAPYARREIFTELTARRRLEQVKTYLHPGTKAQSTRYVRSWRNHLLYTYGESFM